MSADSKAVPAYVDTPMVFCDVEPIDISSELYRDYGYADGKVLRVHSPVWLYVMPNGSHRIIDSAGAVHRPAPGSLAISWKPRAGAPAFVA